MVDEFDGEEYDLGAVAASAGTPPFLTEQRVVVVRNLGRFTSDEVRALTGYLQATLDTTALVVASSGAPPKHLLDAMKSAGATIRDTDPPSRAKDRRLWFDEQLALSGLRLDTGRHGHGPGAARRGRRPPGVGAGHPGVDLRRRAPPRRRRGATRSSARRGPCRRGT